jgi:tRNA A37 threonylcarbamoyladenosine dehydratase
VDEVQSRRFGGVARLHGGRALDTLARAHVCVVGVGGVGSWCVEGLARSGVGRLTLVDMDHVSESNINRQLPALDSTLGAAKIEVMRARIADISPRCVVHPVDDFVTIDNLGELIPRDAVLVDAIDQPRVKAAMIAQARLRGQPVIVCGAAGARIDPLALRCEDLALTRGDALLAAVRSRLRKAHGFSREPGRKFSVPVIYSIEVPRALPDACEPMSASENAGAATPALAGAPLACGGYGSLVTVTAPMGFAAAAAALDFVLRAG